MGYRVGDRCFGTQSDATDSLYSAVLPSSLAGSVGYVQWLEKVSGVWQVKRLSVAADGTATVQPGAVMASMTFPECSVMDNFNDGMLLGWGIGGAMLLVYAVKFIAKGLQNEPSI